MTDGGDARGHCCWPGQVYATGQQQCIGEPTCAAGTIRAFGGCAPAVTDPSTCAGDATCVRNSEECARGDGPACRVLIYRYGQPDRPRAIELARRGCELGDGPSCGSFAYYLRHEDAVRDLARAHDIDGRGCDLQNAASCVQLAVDFNHGRGTRPDASAMRLSYRRAAEAYERACGDWRFCIHAGFLFASDRAGPPDVARARTLFERALGSSDARAFLERARTDASTCTREGNACRLVIDALRELGRRDRAIELLQQACAQQAAWCGLLARFGRRDIAVQRLEGACDGGDTWACYTLASVLAESTHDFVGARSAFSRYCASASSREMCPMPDRDPVGQQQQACSRAAALTLGASVRGRVEGSNELTSLCGGGATGGGEQVYRVTLQQATRVRVSVSSAFDAVVSVRRTCERYETERACNDDGPNDWRFGERSAELVTDLEAGTWFVIVDAFNATQSGAFELLVETVPR